MNPRTPRAVLDLYVAGHPVDSVDLQVAIATLLMSYDEIAISLEDMDAATIELSPPAEHVMRTLGDRDDTMVYHTVSTASCTLLDDFMHRRACSLVVRSPAGDDA